MKMPHHRILLWILVFALLPFSSFAETTYMVVAGNGLIHKLQTGIYSDLFPEGFEANADSRVLAMDILGPNSFERLLVPTSEDAYPEIPAALYYEKRSNTTYVLWEGLFNGIHPFLNLAGYDNMQWAEPITITGNVFADKGHAELVFIPEPKYKRDSRFLESAVDRSVIYVTWQEATPIGPQKYLVPIVLQGGIYLGWHETFQLSRFIDSANDVGGPLGNRVSADLENLLRIQSSKHINGIIVGFTDIYSGQLVTLEIELLPQALSALAAELEFLIRQHGDTSNTVQELADKVRISMMGFDGDFHPGMLDYLADQIETLLQEHSTVAAAVAPGIPEKLGVHIIHTGSRFRAKGLIDPEPREIIQIGQTHHGGAPYHHLKVSVISEREAPEVDGPALLFLSRTGLDALVAWPEEGTIAFRETNNSEWGEKQTIELRDDLDERAVYRILADRTLNR